MERKIHRMPCPECGALEPEELGYDIDNVARLKCKKCGTCYRSDYTKKEKKDEKKDEGLCSNCEHRETCTYPNARNNVLFCEEYE